MCEHQQGTRKRKHKLCYGKITVGFDLLDILFRPSHFEGLHQVLACPKTDTRCEVEEICSGPAGGSPTEMWHYTSAIACLWLPRSAEECVHTHPFVHGCFHPGSGPAPDHKDGLPRLDHPEGGWQSRYGRGAESGAHSAHHSYSDHSSAGTTLNIFFLLLPLSGVISPGRRRRVGV